MPTDERRVVRAIDEAQDPRDAAAEMIRFWEKARADGHISAAEAMEVRIRLARIQRECDEALLAVQWADAGERRAAGHLLGHMPAHVDRYERSILRRAQEIGYAIADNIVQFPVADATGAD